MKSTDASRRGFLLGAPAAAIAGFTLAEAFSSVKLSAEDLAAGKGEAFQHFAAAQLAADARALQGEPGNKNLVSDKEFAIVMTTETGKSAKEFEWHEGRDHILFVIDGETVYELGGAPKGAHKLREGEWLAPESEGATRIVLKKGDLVTIPRGTLHRRSTADSVTFFLISPSGVSK